MNIYDKKVVRCVRCQRSIGEVDFDAQITYPLCGDCGNPMPKGFDEVIYGKAR